MRNLSVVNGKPNASVVILLIIITENGAYLHPKHDDS